MNEDEKVSLTKVQLTAYTCGPRCTDGTENHKWDGPIVKLDNGGTSSCSVCGKLAIEVSMWL